MTDVILLSMHQNIIHDVVDKDPNAYCDIAQPWANVNLIEINDDGSEANIFVFATYADKRTVVLYSNLTGSFPFMYIEGNICFLIIYHYETNAPMALPFANFTDNSILVSYKQKYGLLESKGYKIK
jgi:hypothetical protein